MSQIKKLIGSELKTKLNKMSENKMNTKIVITEEAAKVLETIVKETKFPADFIEELHKNDLNAKDKLVVMYYFAQGHMHGAVNSLINKSLPVMMGLVENKEE